MSRSTELLRAFVGRFPPSVASLRTIGREAEFPVVDSAGQAGDVQALLHAAAAEASSGGSDAVEVSVESVGDGSERIASVKLDAFTDLAIEVGTGTVEVITGPFSDLHSLRMGHEDAMRTLLKAADQHGLRVLGCGLQPVTPPSRELMTRRPRYEALLDLLGPGWLWFASTASDQVHLDVARDELPMLVSVCNAVTPAVVGLCGNSVVSSGGLADFCCAREGLMGEISKEAARHGMPLQPVASMDQWMDSIIGLDLLLRQAADGQSLAPALVDGQSLKPFAWHLDAQTSTPSDWDAFLLHEHYVWHSARPRCKQSTIEIRAACQQPWDGHMAAAALALGVVEAAPELLRLLTSGVDAFEQYLEDETKAGGLAAGARHGDWRQQHSRLQAEWPRLRRLHESAVAKGLADHDVADLCWAVLSCCELGLAKRGLGEETFLAPLWARLENRQNPAQQARDLVQAHGIDAFIQHAAIQR